MGTIKLAKDGKPKSSPELHRDLQQSLQVLRDNLVLLRSGAEHALLPVAAQLFSLLLDKKPLLLKLAASSKESLTVYAAVGRRFQSNGAHISIRGMPISTQKLKDEQTPLPLKKFLCQEVIRVENRTYSSAELVMIVRHKMGGAHYDPSVSADARAIVHPRQGGSPAAKLLIEIGTAVYDLGLDLLAKHFQNLSWVSFVLPGAIDNAIIFSACSNDQARGILLRARNRRLLLQVRDELHSFVHIEIPVALPPVVVNAVFGVFLTKELNTTVYLLCEGIYYAAVFDGCLFLNSDNSTWPRLLGGTNEESSPGLLIASYTEYRPQDAVHKREALIAFVKASIKSSGPATSFYKIDGPLKLLGGGKKASTTSDRPVKYRVENSLLRSRWPRLFQVQLFRSKAWLHKFWNRNGHLTRG